MTQGMPCPRCDGTLVARKLKGSGLELDQCNRCRGLWFDDNELPRILGRRAARTVEIPGIALEDHRCRCPRCNTPLAEFCYPGTITLVDSCRQCGGFWLDRDEWKEISEARSGEKQMVCPKCSTRQARAESCSACGVIVARYEQRLAQQSEAQVREKGSERDRQIGSEDSGSAEAATIRSYADGIPGIKGRLLRFIDRSINRLTSSNW